MAVFVDKLQLTQDALCRKRIEEMIAKGDTSLREPIKSRSLPQLLMQIDQEIAELKREVLNLGGDASAL
ncbi:hypothetical protein IHQ71_30895 (plasmid) [Rhizobium sp. TH2]|uniref:hypothetical protein n=1 Tax=Rhizobium sp. TH2 TaxID=2775403 RepID=UPI002157D52D|nr:hypothetical protein [Rhizobium sp. TH2]UVC12411.1 hypothetical protein IHQ71_30895 [Rhizobium sp. TH2]